MRDPSCTMAGELVESANRHLEAHQFLRAHCSDPLRSTGGQRYRQVVANLCTIGARFVQAGRVAGWLMRIRCRSAAARKASGSATGRLASRSSWTPNCPRRANSLPVAGSHMRWTKRIEELPRCTMPVSTDIGSPSRGEPVTRNASSNVEKPLRSALHIGRGGADRGQRLDRAGGEAVHKRGERKTPVRIQIDRLDAVAHRRDEPFAVARLRPALELGALPRRQPPLECAREIGRQRRSPIESLLDPGGDLPVCGVEDLVAEANRSLRRALWAR